VPCGGVVKALALRSLAIDAARRLGSAEQAAAFLKKALLIGRPEGGPSGKGPSGREQSGIPPGLPRKLKEDLERRLANAASVSGG
ncbi:MAG: hypothetical protein LBB82_09665, partial [Treponema sp.]|nr:hypothetical protein [Treponema sp.]